MAPAFRFKAPDDGLRPQYAYFPTDEAALKLLYLAINNAGVHWRRPVA